MSKEELYFTISGTESEHGFVECDIRRYCNKHDITVKYYRKFKQEHVPHQRECKLVGKQIELNRFKKWCSERECVITLENFWKTQEGLDHMNDVKNDYPRGWSRIERLRKEG